MEEYLNPKIELALPSSLVANPDPQEGPPSIWQPTPRSKLDPIVYNTRDYREACTSSTFDSKTYNFSSPRSRPPQFATGITFLDINKIDLVRLLTNVNDITKESYKVNVHSYGSTVKHGAGCTFFEVSQTDPDFQQGQVITFISPYPDNCKITSFPRFARVFSEDVEIVTWFYQIDADCFKTGFLDIDTNTTIVYRDHFKLVYGSCRKSQNIYNLGTTWIAYPKHKPGIDSGRIDKLKFGLVGAPNEAKGTLTKEMKFKKIFTKPPQVWLALCGICMRFDPVDNLRLMTWVVKGSITTTGFKYDIISWGKAVLETVSLCWLAVELD